MTQFPWEVVVIWNLKSLSPWLQVCLMATLITLSTCALFWPGTTCGFFAFDDEAYVWGNPHVLGGLTWSNVQWAWTTYYASNWHPLTWMSLQLDTVIFGGDAFGYHVTNIVIHALASGLLCCMAYCLSNNLLIAGLVSVLFAWHPLRVESVIWISERKDVLGAFFWILTLWMYLDYARRPGVARYLLVSFSLALGLLSKPMLVTLPCVQLLLDFWPLGRWKWHTDWWRIWTEKLPWFAMCGGASLATIVAQKGAIASLEHTTLAERTINACVSYAAYLGMFICPTSLAPFYPLRYYRWTDPVTWLALSVCAAIIASSLWQFRRRPQWVIGVLWYFGTLVPVIGLLQVGRQALADRYTYIPLIGISLVIASTIAVFAQSNRSARIFTALGISFALGAMWWFTRLQISYWQTPVAVWSRIRHVNPLNIEIEIRLGRALLESKQPEWAIPFFRSALDINPEPEDDVRPELALALMEMQRGDEAEPYLRAVLANAASKAADVAVAHCYLGRLFTQRRDLKSAMAEFDVAIATDSKCAVAYHDRGYAFRNLGDLQRALHDFDKAIEIRPKFLAAYMNRGVVRAMRKELEPAIRDFDRCVALEPRNADAYKNRALAHFQNRQFDRAWADVRMLEQLGGTPNPRFLSDLAKASPPR